MRALRAAAVLLVAGPGAAGADPRARPWFAPDQVKVQTAGYAGLAAAGAGYAWGDRRLEADLLVGWVPPGIAGEHLLAGTAKVTWQPLRIARRGWLLRPLTAGLQVTYTAGDRFHVRLPSRYPDRYYEVPTALRAGISIGGALARTRFRRVAEVGLYWEVVALDERLVAWRRNPRTVALADVVTLALGARVAL